MNSVLIRSKIFISKVLSKIFYVDIKIVLHNIVSCGRGVDRHKKVFYLKVNANTRYSIISLKHWLDVVECSRGRAYIICDNTALRRKIYRELFPSLHNVVFIKSNRYKLIRLIPHIVSKNWLFAGFAHFTVFTHAVSHKITDFWNIDADDTFICAEPYIICNLFDEIELFANRRDVSLFSLDMWYSRSRKKSWTFGVTYTRNAKNTWAVIKANSYDSAWKLNYMKLDNGVNVDWYMTFLRDTHKLRVETWYCENLYFIHFGPGGLLLHNMIGCNFCTWKENRLLFPIILQVFSDETHGSIPIAEDCVKFTVNIGQNESLDYLYRFNLNYLSPILQKLWNVDGQKSLLVER